MITRLALAFRWLARQEAAVLLLAVSVVFAAWVFVVIADAVREGERQAVDDAVLRVFRRADDPARPIAQLAERRRP